MLHFGVVGCFVFDTTVRAVLYTILDFVESGFEEILPNQSCTEKPQEWHKPRTQTPNNAPVRFSDILMIHHDYDADKNNKTDKRIERKREKLAYTACPSYALKVTSDKIYSFCYDLKANSDKSKPTLVYLREMITSLLLKKILKIRSPSAWLLWITTI